MPLKRSDPGYKAEWRSKNPDKERDYYKRYRKKNLEDCRRNSRRHNWRLHGIDPAEAEARLAEHDGTCDICGTAKPGGRSDSWHIDHCHASNRIRGVLCAGCNLTLGGVERAGVEKVVKYLEDFAVTTGTRETNSSKSPV